jgi:DNA-binding GntR family transcriptional regulator
VRNLLFAHQFFHIELARASGNHRMVRAIEQLHHECFRMLYLIIHSEGGARKWDQKWNKGQQMQLQALIIGDGDRAAKLTLAGIQRNRRNVLSVLSRNPSILSGGQLLPLHKKTRRRK